MCVGSDQTFQTSSRGASKTRDATISRAAVSVATGMFLLLAFQCSQIFIQAIETVFPETAIVVDPIGDLLERRGIEVTRTPLCVTAPRDQTGMLENFQMFRYRGQAHIERFGELGDGRIARREASQDCAACRVGQGGEGGSQRVAINHSVN